ncbi:MAG: SDR family oxidoreductase, partial [Candidatus Bathyarchaeota archaeon]|nr:SDR family oxidoreductase [Candidatus Bathyarchaeota archaeon]
METLKVLVTGGAGYIGSILTGKLLEKGFNVVCLDKLFFGDNGIKQFVGMGNFKLIVDDTRTCSPEIFDGVEVLVDLAAISQPDPLGQIRKDLFYEINYSGSLRIATLSKKHGVKKYVFPSTCSVYGFQEGLLSEESHPNPLEEYARTKLMVEEAVKKLSSKNFCVTIVRLATVYGFSKKMRFDLVVNGMTLSLYKTGTIPVMGRGTQVRPVVHVEDVAKAIINIIEVDSDLVNGEVFNVGSNNQNYQVYQLAKLIGDSIGKPYKIEWYGEPDARSYAVDFTKIRKKLNFLTTHTPSDGAREVYKALEEKMVVDSPETKVIQWWRQLQE